MSASDTNASPNFGFLTVVELGDGVSIGGYLVLNELGRPIEFHCTEPVKPNRAQQLLYGATLHSFLYGEQIGRALVQSSEAQPKLILTDLSPVLALRDLIETPVALLSCDDTDVSLHGFAYRDISIRIDRRHAADQTIIEGILGQSGEYWDFSEPLDRIRDAISELRKAA